MAASPVVPWGGASPPFEARPTKGRASLRVTSRVCGEPASRLWRRPWLCLRLFNKPQHHPEEPRVFSRGAAKNGRFPRGPLGGGLAALRGSPDEGSGEPQGDVACLWRARF